MGGRRGCTSGGSSWKGHGCASRQSHGRSVSLLFAAYSCPLCWESWEWSVMGGKVEARKERAELFSCVCWGVHACRMHARSSMRALYPR